MASARARRVAVRLLTPCQVFNHLSYYDTLALDLGVDPQCRLGRAVQWPDEDGTPLRQLVQGHDDRGMILVCDPDAPSWASAVDAASGTWPLDREGSPPWPAGGALARLVADVQREAHSVLEICVVRDGTAAVLAEYPFLREHDSSIFYPQRVLADSHVYISSAYVAQQPPIREHLGVTHVVNCTKEQPNTFAEHGVIYHRVEVDDDFDSPIEQFFDGASAFVDQALAGGGRVLIHCHAGKSRSGALLMAWLMHRDRSLTPAAALAICKDARPLVAPNDAFMFALEERWRRSQAALSGQDQPRAKRACRRTRSGHDDDDDGDAH